MTESDELVSARQARREPPGPSTWSDHRPAGRPDARMGHRRLLGRRQKGCHRRPLGSRACQYSTSVARLPAQKLAPRDIGLRQRIRVVLSAACAADGRFPVPALSFEGRTDRVPAPQVPL